MYLGWKMANHIKKELLKYAYTVRYRKQKIFKANDEWL